MKREKEQTFIVFFFDMILNVYMKRERWRGQTDKK